MKQRTLWFAVAIIAILGLTFGGTHLAMSQYTATEWDEPVYTDVVRAVLIQGYPSFLSGEKIRQEYYAANPPLHFFALAIWDNLTQGGQPTIEGHRRFSSLAATLTVAMAMVCVYQVTRRKRPTLFVGILLATDGWFSYTSLLVKLDTTAILIGLIGVAIFYHGLLDRDQGARARRWQIFGGALMGLAAAYKHVAVVYIVALFFHWMYYRFWLGNKTTFHGHAFVASVVVVAAYVGIMFGTVGDDYKKATEQQIFRATGGRSSSGLNTSLATAIQVLVDTYTAFLGSVGISIFGGGLAFASVGTAIIGAILELRARGKEKRKNEEFVQKILAIKTGSPISFFITLSICSIGLLMAIQLRNPHYLGYAIVPITVVVAYWTDRAMDGSARFSVMLSTWFHRRIDLRRIACIIAYVSLTVLLVLNERTIAIRVFDFGEKEDVIKSAVDVILERVPGGSVIIANEPICRAIATYDYKCVDFRDAIKQKQIDTIRPDVIVDYSTPTTHRPQSNAISVLLSRIDPNADILGNYRGWKRDQVSVIVVNPTFKPLPVKGG